MPNNKSDSDIADIADIISLKGKVAVVTGGAAGIGGGISRLFAQAGAAVVMNDIDESLADSAVKDIESAGGAVYPVIGDIRKSETVEEIKSRALAAADETGGKVDILVNNAGDYRPSGWFIESDEEQWEAQYAITLEHVFRCTRAFLPIMVQQQSGVIVNNSTVEAYRAVPHNSVYGAFNAGIVAFTRTLAVEHGKDNIRVNAIAPDMANTLQTPAENMLRGRDPELLNSWIPLGRFGEPVDYAKVVLFLASDMSGFVTGLTIQVDGGTMASSGWYGRYKKKGWSNLPDLAKG